MVLGLILGFLACQPPPVTRAEGTEAREGGPTVTGEPVPGSLAEEIAIQKTEVESATTSGRSPRGASVERLTVEVRAVYPHDPTAFTQGLVWDGGVLYESTGLYGKSSLRRVEPMSGEVLERRMVDPNLFGEGLALVDGKLLQLTWKAGIALVYEVATLHSIDEFGFNGEGWGLAYDGQRLMMSDGSHRLTERDTRDFRWRATVEVLLHGQPLEHLNELEFADGELYANVWGEERIVRIDPDTGDVTAVIDASNLLTPFERSRVDVLNGIAYDPVSKTFWLTGKFWSKIFQVVFVPAA